MRNKIILDQIKELTEELNKAKTAEEMDEILEQPKHPNKFYVHRLRVDDVFKIEEIEVETKA